MIAGVWLILLDTQRTIYKLGYSSTKRLSNVWPTWYWKNFTRSCLCRTDKWFVAFLKVSSEQSLQSNEHFSNFLEVGWIGIGSNVYWWWCKIGQRCIRIRIEFFLIRKWRFLENVVCSINNSSKTSIIRIFCSNSEKQKKNSPQLFSLMKLMQLVQSVLIQKKLVTEKSKEQCLNFCHNLMVSRRVKSRNSS